MFPAATSAEKMYRLTIQFDKIAASPQSAPRIFMISISSRQQIQSAIAKDNSPHRLDRLHAKPARGQALFSKGAHITRYKLAVYPQLQGPRDALRDHGSPVRTLDSGDNPSCSVKNLGAEKRRADCWLWQKRERVQIN